MAAILATASKTIIDLTDGQPLSLYLGSNHPRTQIYNSNMASSNANVYTPNWASVNLQITPVIYVGQTQLNVTQSINNGSLSLKWFQKAGSSSDQAISTADNKAVLTVATNAMTPNGTKQITYLLEVTYTDMASKIKTKIKSSIDFNLVTTGVNAPSVSIVGETAMKKIVSGTTTAYSPSQITLTANMKNTSISSLSSDTTTGWFYMSGGKYVQLSTKANSIVINPSGTNKAVFNGGNVAEIKLVAADATGVLYSDVQSIHIIEDAPAAFLSNDNVTFVADEQGRIAATTNTCSVVAYVGMQKVTPTVGAPTGTIPQGMTFQRASIQDNEVVFNITVSNNATFGTTDEVEGDIKIPVTSPVKTSLNFHWSKVRTGSAGVNAITFTLYAPNGTVFMNKSGTKRIQVQAYDGATEITSNNASYYWYLYENGAWSQKPLTSTAGQYVLYGNYIDVDASVVPSETSFKCEMVYPKDGNKRYSDVITLTDKTDNTQVEIDSTAGSIFKNSKGDTCLIAHVWQNGQEIDALKSTTFAAVDPQSGELYYKFVDGIHEVKLMRKEGSSWKEATGSDYKTTFTYKWYRNNTNGEPLNNDGSVANQSVLFATGKVIHVNGNDVDKKTVFICEVE